MNCKAFLPQISVYNLSNGIDVEEMNAKVERYKAENEEVLKMAKAVQLNRLSH